MVEDRRRSGRVCCLLPVQLYPQGEPSVIETLTKDIGEGGLRIVSPVIRPVSTPVSIEVTLGTGEQPMSLRAQIVWVRVVPESEQFYLGIAFEDLSELDTKRLSRYIEKVSLQVVQENPT
jgi:c-di-GMP-binding flagellar brake protein YcgR